MGQVTDGLYQFLEPGKAHLVEEEGKKDGRRETEKELETADNNGVSEYLPKAPHAEEPPEIGKAHPWTLHNSQTKDKVLKGYLYPIEGAITEYGVIDKGRQKEEYQIPVFPIQCGQCGKRTAPNLFLFTVLFHSFMKNLNLKGRNNNFEEKLNNSEKKRKKEMVTLRNNGKIRKSPGTRSKSLLAMYNAVKEYGRYG
jgi:hypothetical protein